ncbi:amidase family protein [Microbacterium gorillae]|uniref:amidase family protein n=1 Tax=Microbacterium gorillae TaxID=1231063 RepID=UPI00058F868D|nr:amidase family protein [Microbacterium gorillae]
MSSTGLFAPWSLAELVAELRDGRATPASAHQRALERIDATENDVRAWVSHRFDAPRAGADAPLAGVPLAVKDIIDLHRHQTRCGSDLRANVPPAARDAAIVAAWRAAGAEPLGKTVTTEFAYFAPGPTRNPAAPVHTPGGSSSGSAAAVAAGHVPLALGSQTAGSVIRPAAYCGVAALVMTHASYPTDGVVGLAPSLDSHGVFAARTRDLAVAWAALTYTPVVEPLAPTRLLFWDGAGAGEVDAEMHAAVDGVAAAARARGVSVEPFPDDGLIADLSHAHRVVMAWEAARERAAELARADRLSEPLAELLRTGATTPEAAYAEARATIERAGATVAGLLQAGTVILGPAAPGAAPPGLAATGDPGLSRPWQALGLPVVAVPGLRTQQGLPLGLQVIGHRGDEDGVIRTAQWIEQLVVDGAPVR